MTMQRDAAAGRIPEFTMNDRMRKARESAGISQDDMAAEIGISRRTLSRYENEGSVPRSARLLYSLRTGVQINWIETGAPSASNPDDGGDGNEGWAPSGSNRRPTD